MASGQLGNLTTLIKRLEAATSRLEDMATSQHSASLVNVPAEQQASAAVTESSPNPSLPHLSEISSTAPTAALVASPMVNEALDAYKELMEGPLRFYVSKSQVLGGLVAEQASRVDTLFQAQFAFLQSATRCRKPTSSDPAYVAMLKDTQSALMAVLDIKETGRDRKFQSHLSAVAEGAPALGWVTVEPKPGPYIKEMNEASQFYVNRVIKEYKETDQSHVEWARSFPALLENLRKYVAQHHSTGVSWNPKGDDLSSAVTGSHSNAAIPNAPPPPPAAPAAPARTFMVDSSSPPEKPAGTPSMGNVFAQLNQGEAVTKGLKKVQDSAKVHKNPDLRALPSDGKAHSKPGAPMKPPKPASHQKKPPKTELDGNKWYIENHDNNPLISLADTALNQIVNVFNVKSSVVVVPGKVNAVSIVSCNKLSLLVDSAVSSISITNSPSFTLQITGNVPTITVDATDGGQIYLSKTSIGVEIISAKSSAINVSLPVEGEEEGIFEEKPIPEQLKTVVANNKLITTVLEHSA